MRCDNGMMTAFYSPKDLECISYSEQEEIKREVSRYYNVCKEILNEQRNPLFIEAHNVLMWIRRMANRKDWPLYYITSSDISFARGNSAELFINKKFNASHCCKTIVDLYDRFIARGKRLNRAQYNELRQALLECSAYAYKVKNALQEVKVWYSRRGRLLKNSKRKYDVKTSVSSNIKGGSMLRRNRFSYESRRIFPIVTNNNYLIAAKFGITNPDEYCIGEIPEFRKISKFRDNNRNIVTPALLSDTSNYVDKFKKFPKDEAVKLLKKLKSALQEYSMYFGRNGSLGKYIAYFNKFYYFWGRGSIVDKLIANSSKLGLSNTDVAKLKIFNDTYKSKTFMQYFNKYRRLKLYYQDLVNRYLHKLEGYISGDKKRCFSYYDAKNLENFLKNFKSLLEDLKRYAMSIKARIGDDYQLFFVRLFGNPFFGKYVRAGNWNKVREIIISTRKMSNKEPEYRIFSTNKPITNKPTTNKELVIKESNKQESSELVKQPELKVNQVRASTKESAITSKNSSNVSSSVAKYAPYIAAGGIALLLLMNRD